MKKRQDPPALSKGRATTGSSRRNQQNVISYPGKGPVRDKKRYTRPKVDNSTRHMTVKKRVNRTKAYADSRSSLQTKMTPLYVWGDFDIPFLLLALALLGFGLVMLFSASYARAYYYEDSSFYYIGRQMVWSLIGIIGMIAASFINYQWLRRFAWPLYFVSLGLCALAYAFDAYNGARRTVYIGPINFQPSEIGKFALILLFAHLMSKDQKKMKNLWDGTLRYLVLFGIMAVIVVLQPHLSATVLMAGITVVMLFVGGASIMHLLGIGAVGVAGIAAMVFTMWGFFPTVLRTFWFV